MARFPAYVAVIIPLILGTVPLYAQAQQQGHLHWFAFGFGAGRSQLSAGATDPESINFGANYNFELRDFSYQIGLDYMAQFVLLGAPEYTSLVLHPGIGLQRNTKYVLVSSFIGPDIGLHTSRTHRSDPDPITSRTLFTGVAIGSQFFVKPLAFVAPEVGTGIELFANLNTVQSYYGLRVSVMFSNGE